MMCFVELGVSDDRLISKYHVKKYKLYVGSLFICHKKDILITRIY